MSAHADMMVDLQREMGRAGGVVMEGRDIGTVVFPDADIKFFLDASPEARGQRRYEQAGGPVTSESVEAGMLSGAGGENNSGSSASKHRADVR